MFNIAFIASLEINVISILSWIGIFLAASAVILFPLTYIVASYCVYTSTLKRKSSDTWSRNPVDLDGESLQMFNTGIAWSEENLEFKKDVHIKNAGLNLFGEYYDFGKDRCAVILSGRTESLRYGYYFAIPYAKCGYNILVLDPRAHGLSEGEFNTIGNEESRDAVAWVKFIKEEYGIKSFVFHGICIGAACGMYAITSGECPAEVEAIVTEGMFSRFSESMKNHLIERKKPVFILNDLIDMWMKHYTGHSMKFGPIDVIDKMDKPLLMLQSLEDIYSTPEHAKLLYDKAASENKKLILFEHGAHSMLRITDTEKYDSAIAEFLAELNKNKINNT